MRITSELVLEKETKNCYRFQEQKVDVDSSVVERVFGTIYMQKEIFQGEAPQKMTVVATLVGKNTKKKKSKE